MKKTKIIVCLLLAIGTISILIGCTKETYTLSFVVNDKVESTIMVESTVSELPSEPSITGYKFEGWYIDDNFTKEFTLASEVDEDTKVYAKFNIISYSITYTNTQEAENNNPATYNIETSTFILLDLNKEGYSFDGWFDGEIQVTSIPQGTINDIELEAHWSLETYNIYYMDADEISNINPNSYNIETTTFQLEGLDKEEYDFLGWFDIGGGKVTEIVKGTTGNITLYARFIKTDNRNKIIYTDINHNIKETQIFTPDTFNATCVDINNDYLEVSCEVNGVIKAGNTISVTLSVVDNLDVNPITIEDFIVYGTPTLETYYMNGIYADQVENSKFKVFDTFGKTLSFNIEGETEEGNDIIITAEDAAGNLLSKEIRVIKASTDIFTFDASGNVIEGLSSFANSLTWIVIPDVINGKNITTISSEAFIDNASVTKIILPNSLETIKANAFSGCTSLESIIIPSTVSLIEENAFSGCNNLSIYCVSDAANSNWNSNWNSSNRPVYYSFIPNRICYNSENLNLKYTETDKLSKLSINPFYADVYGNSYTVNYTIAGTVAIGETVTITLSVEGLNVTEEILNFKIFGAPIFESIYSEVIYLDEINNQAAFTALDSFGTILNVQVPESYNEGDTITLTVEDAAGNRESLDFKVIKATTEVLTVNPSGNSITGIGASGSVITTLIIPESIESKTITAIFSDAFKDNTILQHVVLPNTVNTIGANAFSGCTSLESIVIPANVTTIEANAFSGCTSLIIYYKGEKINDNWNEFWNPLNRTVYCGYEPNKICYTLDSLNIKEAEISKLDKAAINPYYTDLIGKAYTVSYSKIGTLSAGNTVTITLTVDDGILNNLVLSVKIFGTPTIKTNIDTDRIYVDQINNESIIIARDSFGDKINLNLPNSYNIGEETTLTATDLAGNSVSMNLTLNISSEDVFNVEGDKITGLKIFDNALRDSVFSKFIIPNRIGDNVITKIGEKAFTSYIATKKIKEAIMCEGITTLDDMIFQGCESLISVCFANTVKTIGDKIFHNCSNLERVTLPLNIESIPIRMFQKCEKITSFDIPNTVTTIEPSAFSCTGLTNINIPNSVKKIGAGAFYECTSLKTVNIPNSVQEIGATSFFAAGLTTIFIPLSVKVIGEYAFTGCNDLLIINCAAASKPDKWNNKWNRVNFVSDVDTFFDVEWNYTIN